MMPAEGSKAPEAGAPVSDEELVKLARTLFEVQERLLPDGQVWDDLSSGDREFWISSVEVVVREYQKLRG
jgi:hypothetical protein